MFAKYISRLEIQEAPRDIPGISNYNLNQALLAQDGYLPVEIQAEPSKNQHKVYELHEDKIIQTVEDNLPEEVVSDPYAGLGQEGFRRFQRDSLLRDTDFTQLIDAPFDEVTKDSYKLYRQYLRDYPSLSVFPDEEPLKYDSWKNASNKDTYTDASSSSDLPEYL